MKPTTADVLTVAMVTLASIRRRFTVISDGNTATAVSTAAAAATAAVGSNAQIQVLNVVERLRVIPSPTETHIFLDKRHDAACHPEYIFDIFYVVFTVFSAILSFQGT